MIKPVRVTGSFALGLLFSAASPAQDVLELRPNLIALPAFDISVGIGLFGNPELRFSVTTANLGDGPLEFRGGESGSGKQNVYQRVYLDDGTYYDHLAGSFIFHPEHNHIHVEDYAEYALQQLGARGSSQRTSEKTSFCVMDTDRIDTHLPGASKKPVYDTCESMVQGLSVGWGDTYGAYLFGQEIDLTDLPDGDYTLTITADPKSRFIETNDADNSSCVLLRIGVSDLTLDVLNATSCDEPGAPPSEVTVDSIDPNFGTVGSVVPVTITGTGFSSGMQVSFENGSGARLIVSDVVVLDAQTITALVTVRNKGARDPDYVWDVRVDGGVLVDGFTVLP